MRGGDDEVRGRYKRKRKRTNREGKRYKNEIKERDERKR
jgi:hypothetical protein